MENERISENEINILDMLFIIKKNIFKIIAAAVITAVVFLAYTLTMVTPVYRSTTQLLIKGISQEAMSIYPDSTSRIMLVNNSIEVLSGTEVMQDVIDVLSLEMTPEQLQGCVSISSPADTQVLRISAMSPDPELAKDISATLADIAHGALAENVGIAALSSIQEAKSPTAPVAPNPIKNTIMGGFLGGLAAAAFFIIMWFINNKIYTPADAEKALGLTVFSSIPLVEESTLAAESKDTKSAKEEK